MQLSTTLEATFAMRSAFSNYHVERAGENHAVSHRHDGNGRRSSVASPLLAPADATKLNRCRAERKARQAVSPISPACRTARRHYYSPPARTIAGGSRSGSCPPRLEATANFRGAGDTIASSSLSSCSNVVARSRHRVTRNGRACSPRRARRNARPYRTRQSLHGVVIKLHAQPHRRAFLQL